MAKELSLDDVKRLHYNMWEYIADNETDSTSRNLLKSDYIKKHANDYVGILHSCFCCEYAKQEYEKSEDRGGNFCKYCPAIWGSEDDKIDYFCENMALQGLDWLESKPMEVANVVFK